MKFKLSGSEYFLSSKVYFSFVRIIWKIIQRNKNIAVVNKSIMHNSAAKKNRQSTDILERLKNEYNYILHEVLTSTVSFKQLKFLLRFLITNSTPPPLESLLGRGLWKSSSVLMLFWNQVSVLVRGLNSWGHKSNGKPLKKCSF